MPATILGETPFQEKTKAGFNMSQCCVPTGIIITVTSGCSLGLAQCKDPDTWTR